MRSKATAPAALARVVPQSWVFRQTARLQQQQPAVQNAGVERYVTCVAKTLLSQVRSNLDWEVEVFKNDDIVNAFALPGGKIGVYTGLLKVADTPEELAAVLAHEIAHVIARHGAERVSQQVVLGAG